MTRAIIAKDRPTGGRDGVGRLSVANATQVAEPAPENITGDRFDSRL